MKKLLIVLVLLLSSATLTSAEEKVINFQESINSTVKVEVGNFKGSGVLISEDLVLTASHVLAIEGDVTITFYDKTKVKGELIKRDQWYDLALIKIEEVDEIYVDLALESPKYGDNAFAIGHPLSLEFVLSRVIISNPDQVVGFQGKTQFDGIIYPGNSGGPLFNDKGELIGIVTNVLQDNGEMYVGLNFATQLKYIKEFLKDEIK